MEAFVTLDAVAVPLPLPNIDTDQIIPARFLSRPREVNHADFLFHDARRVAATGEQNPEFPLNREPWRAARVIVAGKNFACGSSREAAVWALFDAGFRCAIAPSFGDIFRNNGTKNGLLPVVLPAAVVEDILAQLEASPGARIFVDLPQQQVTAPDGSVHGFEIDPFAKHCMLNGLDDFGVTAAYEDDIAAFERRYGRENRI
ncbi:3-isopropylmalate dehydratase small subunit [Siccirubricoccus sp. KC 17139]|uniref:3-isopropylmalate dehydratase small subunit n=1 Tax=Siccirubricoccus soli TaxID=2899147 RepID=A0ABT1D7A6_9PROT|nr:3-isopropylmalate dehydratase small subunit [Siccirubricoccus soli]MCO6417816.1 3-isopropylmalate dehydratase small subunit [Siccirubricoccus soli]MCP2683951.1 3-isopropylmalate dehydratase small subunit [Siccirubricoccus soli]